MGSRYKHNYKRRIFASLKENGKSVATAAFIGACVLVSTYSLVHKPSAKIEEKVAVVQEQKTETATSRKFRITVLDDLRQNFSRVFSVFNMKKTAEPGKEEAAPGQEPTQEQVRPSETSPVRSGEHKYAMPEQRPDTLDLTALAAVQMDTEKLKKISVLDSNPENARLWKEFIEKKCNAMTYLGAPRSVDRYHTHNGVDIFAPINTPVSSPVGGQVIFAGKSNGGYGGLVIVRCFMDGEIHYVLLGHLQHDTEVSLGDVVKPGDVVGRVGPHYEGAHCHIELIKKVDQIIESKKELPSIENGVNKIGLPKEELPKGMPSLGDTWDKKDLLATTADFRNPAGKFNRKQNPTREFIVENFYKSRPVEEGRFKFPIEYRLVKDVSKLNRALFQKNTHKAASSSYRSFTHSSGE